MTSLEQLKQTVPLIAPKHFSQYTPEEYHNYVQSMYELRKKGSGTKKAAGAKSPVLGLSLSRTKKGALSIRRNKQQRPFEYILQAEIDLFVKAGIGTTAEVWNTFKAKKFLITKTKVEADEVISKIKEIPRTNSPAL